MSVDGNLSRHGWVRTTGGIARDPELMDDPGHSASDGLLDFQCPRCGATVAERFYGPCRDCRSGLRAALGGEGRTVDVGVYEPKMNVTPNQVATKD